MKCGMPTDFRELYLLIEPYGIEMLQAGEISHIDMILLIEPYGIEIIIKHDNKISGHPFNRTLWN